MDLDTYRKRFDDDTSSDAAEEAVAPPTELLRADASPADVERIAVIRGLLGRVHDEPEVLTGLLDILGDAGRTDAERLAALDTIQAATFLGDTFAPYRARYMEVLRSIVTASNKTLRRRAIGILSREGDESIQRRLLDGLEHPSRALVPAAKAIQYLAYDVHAESFPILRRIVEDPPTQAARREAIRVLAADPKSRALLTGILNDKSEPRDIRYASALSLNAMAPERFAGIARKIAVDETEDDRLRATSLMALAHAPEGVEPSSETFDRKVERQATEAGSAAVKRASRTYTARTRR